MLEMSDQENERLAWARMVAHYLVDGALDSCSQKPVRDQQLLLREIAKRALEHFADRSNRTAAPPRENLGSGKAKPVPAAESTGADARFYRH